MTSAQQSEQVMDALKAVDPTVALRGNEFVGPQVGEELTTNGLKALGMVVVGIMIYLAFRFEWKFALATVLANLHDVVIILGFFAFFQWEFSLAVLAAVLAVLGYSVNESVVIFDRVRENFRRYRKMSTRRDHRQRDHLDHQPDHHHPRLDAAGGAVDVLLRRPDAALLRAGADHRHLLRHLLVGLRGGGHRHVAGRQARRPGQGRRSSATATRTIRTPAPSCDVDRRQVAGCRACDGSCADTLPDASSRCRRTIPLPSLTIHEHRAVPRLLPATRPRDA